MLAGRLPESSLHRLDYGISFGVAACVGALAGLLTPWLRLPLLALFGGMLAARLIAYADPMTDWGHLIALATGIAIWPLLRARPARPPLQGGQDEQDAQDVRRDDPEGAAVRPRGRSRTSRWVPRRAPPSVPLHPSHPRVPLSVTDATRTSIHSNLSISLGVPGLSAPVQGRSRRTFSACAARVAGSQSPVQ
ncbi:rhomboid-like protein [Streptomyces sp. AF1B]|uniref:rhomboid-like protein n=1 Tax=Streptomyces sp. AF1B TaxID=3399503 RepID=UPI003AAD48E8